jgi:OmpR-family two-component system manganese-sensing response regulator
MPRILLVEDDKELAEKIATALKFQHYQVEVMGNGDDAIELLKRFEYDLIILDWNLPEKTGIEICQSFRSRGGNTPILFLTGRGSILDKETGFMVGGDDYLTKPFHIRELSARIRALLRRPHETQPESLKVGRFSLEIETYRVFIDGEPVKLLPKEFALLAYLMKHPNEPFSSSELLEKVWESDTDASEDTIRTYIKTLRRKITPAGEDCPLTTMPGYGYKLEVSDDQIGKRD